ncbi:uncharacterized protein LOC125544792 isoform X2 [Triticum urartu]|uniref:uncharacterized protein LOC125544792 isoform X2 n=1 Tax=Triticum urartu TaxID=4572 RepID=UPI002043F12C|nr:uncharacterized protein LOC125544792 isoform X2 [Triticum urartu]
MPPTAVAPILSPPIPYPHQMRRQEGGKSTERARSGGGQIRHERQLLPRLGAQSPSSLPPWSPPPRVELLPPWKWRAFFYPAGHGAAAPWKEGLELVEVASDRDDAGNPSKLEACPFCKFAGSAMPCCQLLLQPGAPSPQSPRHYGRIRPSTRIM